MGEMELQCVNICVGCSMDSLSIQGCGVKHCDPKKNAS